MINAIQPAKKGQHDDRFGETALPSGLYLVATPIGNLRDITLRALDVLVAADLILAEDTRHSKRLLDRYDIRTPMRAFHEHNADAAQAGVLAELDAGKSLALISDAGTPLISDPGFKLVRAASKAGFSVIPIPGPSAVLTALCASGLPTDRFLFVGFPPAKTQARQRFFEGLVSSTATLVFFESPKRILRSLVDMEQIFGDRQVVLARELTKIHETFYRQTVSELLASLQDTPIRGECVLVLAPAANDAPELSEAQIDQALLLAMEDAGVKAAAREVARISGRKIRDLYARALVLRSGGS
jgi:16S rRNA (cytidine1402-2'-O)-methyltransferase